MPTSEERAEMETLKMEVDRTQRDRKYVARLLAEKRKEEESLKIARGEVADAKKRNATQVMTN